MRVIAGRYRSRKLKSIPGEATRPTPDRLRESLFGILTPRLEGAVFLDGYAGTGAVGIEAISRGARQAILIESARKAQSVIEENLHSLTIGSEAILVRGRVVNLLNAYRPDIAFLDPPYDKENEYAGSLLLLAEGGCPLVIAQHSSRFALADAYGSLTKVRIVKQGDNSLSFYELSNK